MTLDYTKMFLIVTEEAVVKGHFARGCSRRQFVLGAVILVTAQTHPVSLHGHITEHF